MRNESRLISAFGSIVGLLRVLNFASVGIALLAFVATFLWGDTLRAHLVARYGEAGVPALIYLRAICLCCVPAAYILDRVLGPLGRIVATLRAGDPFATGNTNRLRTIGWALLGLQVMDLLLGMSTWWAKAQHIRVVDWQPSITGWLGVLVAFVLARVFADGAAMRDDLAGTV